MNAQTSTDSMHFPTTDRHPIVAMVAIARGLVTSLMDPREKFLKHKAPKSASVHQLRRDIKAGKQRPMESLIRIGFADLEDGIPLAMATQWAQEYLTAMEQHDAMLKRRAAGVLADTERVCRAAVRETRAQSVGDVDVQEVLADVHNPAKLRRAISDLQVEESEREELEAVLTEVLVTAESA